MEVRTINVPHRSISTRPPSFHLLRLECRIRGGDHRVSLVRTCLRDGFSERSAEGASFGAAVIESS